MLYPITNNNRAILDLSGIWSFKLGKEDYENDISFEKSEPIYVPSSYNDQKDTEEYRNHYGLAYYQREFTVPSYFQTNRIVLRFDAVTHKARVLLNGELIAENKGGFLPFEVEITNKITFGKPQRLTVAVDNKIDSTTLPVGNENSVAFFGSDNAGIPSVEAGKLYAKKQNVPNFDFFNFAGINRKVRVIVTPKEYIKDITLLTDIDGTDGIVDYSVNLCGNEKEVTVKILDENQQQVGKACGENGRIIIKNANLWQPYPDKPYLYTAEVTYGDDCYSLNFGIRTVKVDGSQLLINGKPFYFKGAGKHEDSPFHGRGIDECLNVKDVNLLHLIGANSIRTSHYPYAEEMYALCDREGIVIIDETPAVGIGGNKPYERLKIKDHHRDVIKTLIKRDKNHPSVIMWSLGNEPELERYPQEALNYWRELYDLAHSLDKQNRPVTVVCCQNDYTKDITTRTMDVVCINRYYGWYNLSGDLDAAAYAFNVELDFWQEQNKPVILTEYGADAVAGMHRNVPQMFSEEYQVKYFEAINSVLDKREFVIGEHPWNFADFDTFQGCMRVGGNKKGLFTRERHPKMVAHYFKDRWLSIPNFDYKKG